MDKISSDEDAIDFFAKFHDQAILNDQNIIKQTFGHFDKNDDGFLDLNEFGDLVKKLFSYNGNSYFIPKDKVEKMYDHFKSDKAGLIDIDNFKSFWSKIVQQTLLPRSALIIVDVQNDFITGSLSLKNCPAKQDGSEVVPVINELIKTVPFDVIAYTLDWHPDDHCSFIDNVHNRKISDKSPITKDFKLLDTVIFDSHPDADQKLWPKHCVQNTKGSELHPDLRVVDPDTDEMKRAVIYTHKGYKSDIDSYSAFFDNCKLNETTLDRDLKKHQITDIYVCGIASDICVAATAYDGLSLNYRVVYVVDATRGVDFNDMADQKKILINHGALMVNSNQVKDMITGKNRRPELGYATFQALA